jgi:hypothetical protein
MSAIDRREGTTPNPRRSSSARAISSRIRAAYRRRSPSSGRDVMVFASRRTVELDQQLGGQESLLDKRQDREALLRLSAVGVVRTRVVPLVTRSNVTSQRTQPDPTFPRWAIALVAPTSLRARSGWRPRDGAAAGSGAIGLPRLRSPSSARWRTAESRKQDRPSAPVAALRFANTGASRRGSLVRCGLAY